MKKTLKITLSAVAVLLAAALVVPLALRGRAGEIVKREANAMLRARLDFSRLDISLLRHFPHASLELRDLTLVGVDRFEGDTIAAAGRISVVVDLMSLFGDEGFEVTKVILSDPAVRARKCADGAVNWDVVKPSEQPAEPSAADEKSGSSAFRLSVRELRIEGASVRYDDDSTHLHFSAAPLSMRLRGDLSAERTDLALRLDAQGMTLRSGGVPLLSGAEAGIKAVVAADLKNRRFTLSENTLRLNAIELSVDGWAELRDEALALDMKASCERVRFKEVLSLIPAFYTREFRNLSASGELDLALWARGELRGSSLPAFELRIGVRDGSFRYSSLPQSVSDIRIAARAANPGGGMDLTEIDLSECSMKMAGNSLSATFHAAQLASDPVFRASVDGHVDLGSIREVYPLEKGVELDGGITADIRVAGRMSDIEAQRYDRIAASGTFVVEGVDLAVAELPEVHVRRLAATITPQSMTLGDFGVTVGRSDLSANGQLTGYLGYLLRGERLSGRLYVKSQLLDLNELLGAVPASEDAEQDNSSDEAQPLRTPVVPDNLDLSLHTELRKVLFREMTLGDLTGEMRASGGTLSLDRLAMELFGGRATASGRYSAGGEPLRGVVRIKTALSGASFARTFEESGTVRRLVPLFAKTGGDYSLSLDLKTALDGNLSPDLQSVDASGELRSANIRLQNIEAFDALARVLGNDAFRRIEARDVAIRFAIRNGRVATQPFDLKLGAATLNLSGSTGLDSTIDYTARVSLPGGGSAMPETLDLKIGGTFSDPEVRLDVKSAVEETVRKVVDEQVQRLTGSESLADELEKQAANLRSEAQRAGERLVSEAQRAGEKLVGEAQRQRDRLVSEAARKGALAKLAAEKAGDKLVDEAGKQAAKLTDEAERQAAKLLEEAERQIERLSAND